VNKNSTAHPNLTTEDSFTPITRTIKIGIVERPYTYSIKEYRPFMRAIGVVTEVKRNMPSPCFRWCGSYARGKPVFRTEYASYSPVRLQMEAMGKKGYPQSLCGHRDCIRLDHFEIIPYPVRMASIHPRRRDSLGRFIKED
jgi:hypothetical protein